MSLPLQLWIIERYTKAGDVILDPMAGSGTILIACSLGRNVIVLDLEQKFVDMMRGNWEKIKQRGPQMGYKMGEAVILQGDARNLERLLADKVIFSPPFSEQGADEAAKYFPRRHRGTIKPSEFMPGNIQNLPYGQIDKIITSPPYAKTLQADNDSGQRRIERLRKEGHDDIADRIEKAHNWHQHEADYNPDNPDNIGNLPYGEIDAVITSPPYERSLKLTNEDKDIQKRTERMSKAGYKPKDFIHTSSCALWGGYSENKNNIGNLKSGSYLSAMLQVYQECWRCLKIGGLMILVVKNFIRNKKEIRLDLDTIKLCEQAKFTFQERWYRELPAQSFWRILYRNKYPEAPEIKFEDVLIFRKNEI